MIDLHTHSTASDGSLSPAALVRAAKEQGLSALALTDHDTIAGLEEAGEEAKKRNIRFIPGIEFEIICDRDSLTIVPPGEFHLLGLGITRPGPAFFEAVDSLARSRESRNRKILEKLEELNVRADYDELRSFAGGGSIGRPHIADLLIHHRIVKNREQAFSRYLGKGRPFYLPKEGLRFTHALSLIRESGALAVLAHPLSLYVAWGRLPALIRELAALGLDGIEAWHPVAKPQSCKRLEGLGKELGLRITWGSDFHGEVQPGRRLGFSAGGRKIDEAVLDAIPELASPG
ncbi:MAG: PHP domain-containing protein [Treponema sp.]|jgi:predicted metal-dependent phosphoesterase TrpH|nr:PHP domain-containing protein [Treponema sp.]